MALRHFNIRTGAVDEFLTGIGAFCRITCYKWSDVFLNHSFDEFVVERRGGKRGDGFYDLYPEIEIEARAFAVEACSRKAASFTVQELAQYIDSKFYELHGLKKTGSGLVRSVESVRLDLRKWGIHYSANGLRPYFLGHERPDVIEPFSAHNSGPFFRLSDHEYSEALEKYPELEDDEGIRYEANSATASIAIGNEGYFDNETILAQFERFFKLLGFKAEYRGHQIELLVDNATTHSKKDYSVMDFPKKIGTRCEVQSIDCLDDNGDFQTLNCFFTTGEHKGKSKGMVVIGQKLGLSVTDKMTVEMLRQELATHPAFKTVSCSPIF
ncbi:unnamed protein product [Didymodactylos carnosus]|uniref:Uncharacterized protein n=1 Tax=Didymodactylos carnosus TaxID=1234261 RepID=A0A814ET54_9BILA|nr:unnamed protein product [Didymodactylos carnosus]CAF3749301.1 unnamed protein product [Didymodactylos carnosus]